MQTKIFFGLICLVTSRLVLAADINVVTLKNIPELKGPQELSLVTVEYGPGESTPPHRHNAHTLVYVLSGSIETQVQGGDLVVIQEGEHFYETPTDIHIVSRNPSATEGAKILVMYLKPPGTPSQLVDP